MDRHCRLIASVWAWVYLFLGVATVPLAHVQSSEPQANAKSNLSARPSPPVKDGLELWIKSDDLAGMKEGELVGTWPDSSGRRRHLVSTGTARPRFKVNGIAGHPTIVFAGDVRANPKVVHSLKLPLTGEWKGVSVFAVGKGLAGAGWFDSAPGGLGCLRTCGFLQLTGNKVGSKGFKNLGHRRQ